MLDPNQICEARHELSLSQHELARRACVSRTALNQFEQGNYSAGPNFCRKLRDYFEAEGIELDAANGAPPTLSATPVAPPLVPKGAPLQPHILTSSDGGAVDAPETRLPRAIELVLGVGLSLILGRRIGL